VEELKGIAQKNYHGRGSQEQREKGREKREEQEKKGEKREKSKTIVGPPCRAEAS